MVTLGVAHRALAEALGPRATLLAPLGALTTYGVGGPAAVFVEVEEPADLDVLRSALRDSELPLFVIGRGSNLLVADAGFDGVVIRLGAAFATLELPAAGDGSDGPAGREGGALVRAGAALALPVLARRVADAGWSGLSWAVGVPGSVGGAVRMNAGGHGSDMASCLARYTWVDLRSDEGGTDGAARLDYAYRSSSVTASQLVLAAELRVAPGRGDDRAGSSRRGRPLAACPPAGWIQCGLGLHQPRGRRRGPAHRRSRTQGLPARQRARVGEACQFHPGGQGRPGRRRACPHGARPRGGG